MEKEYEYYYSTVFFPTMHWLGDGNRGEKDSELNPTVQ